MFIPTQDKFSPIYSNGTFMGKVISQSLKIALPVHEHVPAFLLTRQPGSVTSATAQRGYYVTIDKVW